MTFGFKQWDENGRELANIPFETLIALSPLTDDPEETLQKLGLKSEELKSALVKIAEIVKAENK